MAKPRTSIWIAAWILFLGFYVLVSRFLGPGRSLNRFGDIAQCCVPLLANAGLLINAGTPHWRRNLFWMLLALSSTCGWSGNFNGRITKFTCSEHVPSLFAWDIIFFLRGIPLMAALALRPYLKRGELRIGLGYMDFALLLTWWTFVYVYVVLPWMYATPTLEYYDYNYYVLANIQYVVIIAGFAAFWCADARRVADCVCASVWCVHVVYARLRW